MDDAVPEGPLRHRVTGKALTNSVGWVDGCGALALWDHLWSRKCWLTDMDLFSLRPKVKTCQKPVQFCNSVPLHTLTYVSMSSHICSEAPLVPTHQTVSIHLNVKKTAV